MNNIPHFALFGDVLAENDPEFIHVETIRARSKLYDWRITPHMHPHLFQLVFVRSGAATVRLDDRQEEVPGPGAVTLPSGVVHAFSFERDTTGHVVTIANLLVTESARHQSRELLKPVVAEPRIFTFGNHAENGELLDFTLAQMRRELKWRQPGSTSMFRWYLRVILMTLSRQLDAQQLEAQSRGRRFNDFGRFRRLLEEHYRDHWSVRDYAGALAVSPSKLNRLCRQFAGRSALDVINDRTIVEAQRLLLYTDAPVTTIAAELGFRDPGYFCRFFKRYAGVTPTIYRQR